MSSKGVVFNIQRFSINDGPGIRTTVFLKGCPLTCQWCHNPEGRNQCISIFNGKADGWEITTEELKDLVLKDQLFYEESGGGITLSGGEPFAQAQFTLNFLQVCQENHVSIAVDTTGYFSEDTLKESFKFNPIYLYDLKLMNTRKHMEYAGVSNKRILNNLIWLIENKATIIIRIPLIPEITATRENIGEIIEFLRKLNFKGDVNLLPFHQIGEQKYLKYNLQYSLKNKPSMPYSEVMVIKERFIKNGFNATIGG